MTRKTGAAENAWTQNVRSKTSLSPGNNAYIAFAIAEIEFTSQARRDSFLFFFYFIYTLVYPRFESQCYAQMINKLLYRPRSGGNVSLLSLRGARCANLFYLPSPGLSSSRVSILQSHPSPVCNKPLFLYGVSPSGYFPI